MSEKSTNQVSIKELMREHGRHIAAEFAKMPKCECGHARIRHGINCDSSCVEPMCDCYRYIPEAL